MWADKASEEHDENDDKTILIELFHCDMMPLANLKNTMEFLFTADVAEEHILTSYYLALNSMNYKLVF